MSGWREKAAAELRRRGGRRLVHGSEAREILAECGAGAGCDGHEAEKLLEATLEPVLEMRQPTHSQLAWASLGNMATPPKGFGVGSKEFYYWRAKPELRAEMCVRAEIRAVASEPADETWCYTCDWVVREITGSTRYCAECDRKFGQLFLSK